MYNLVPVEFMANSGDGTRGRAAKAPSYGNAKVSSPARVLAARQTSRSTSSLTVLTEPSIIAALTAPPRRAWTVAEVAASVGVGRSTVYGWIEEGRLHAFRSGSIVRVTAAELDRFLEERAA